MISNAETSIFEELTEHELANIEGGKRRGGRRTGNVTYTINVFDDWRIYP